MDTLNLIKAFALGLVEGATEFLPVSSTGHLILAGDLLAFDSGAGKVFEVVIQLGAILAVCWLFRGKIVTVLAGVLRGERASLRFCFNLSLAFLPSVVFGVLFIKTIKTVFFDPPVVAAALVIGGFVILVVERRERSGSTATVESINWRQALGVGAAQVFAMIPGVSRSGATIIGGILGGVSRPAATEFSFFLAIPTIFGATVLDLSTHGAALTASQGIAIAVGFMTAFASAIVVIKLLIRFIAHHTLRVFAWYRIALGVAILIAYSAFSPH